MDEPIDTVIARLEARIAAQDARIEALEARPIGLQYRGVWHRDETYSKHDGASHRGSLWICRADSTRTTPGVHPSWQLAVKKGRDGKDAR